MLNTQNNYGKGDIVAFKLVNGDEIIAEVHESNMSGWTVKRPCTVMPSQQGIGLMQSLFTGKTEKTIELSKQHVMLHAETIEEIRSHYIKTTTGIDTAPQQRIVV